MISLPISVLTTKDENIISLTTIQEHQKFCKDLLQSYHSFKKKKTGNKDKNKFKSELDFYQSQKKPNQEEILKWFINLELEEKRKICCIQNKWLINLFIQLYLLTNTYDVITFEPIIDMENLFKDHKNFSHMDDSYNNIYTNINYSQGSKYDLSFYENFFKINFDNSSAKRFNKQEEEKRNKEKEFIDEINIISLDEENLDTLVLSKEILIDEDKLKNFLKYFSSEKCFLDWLLPIHINNSIYNFVFPSWLHGKGCLSLFELIAGYIEQQILLHYEYFYYSKKIYEYSYSNKIVALCEENQKLLAFVNENYSTFGNSDTEKKEFISRMEIREIVHHIRKDEKIKKKIYYIYDIYKSILQNDYDKNGDNLIKKDLDQNIYENLYHEMINFGVEKVIEHITFPNFLDIINFRDIVFFILRKRISDSQCKKVLDELINDDNIKSHPSNNKIKKKNKRKKKKNKNNDKAENDNNSNEEINKVNDKNENISSNSNKKKGRDAIDNNEDIKEYKNEDKEINMKKEEFNININNVKKYNNLENEIKSINIKNNFNEEFIIEKESNEPNKLTNIKLKPLELKEENINIKITPQDDISLNKNKNKEMFLFPTNIAKKKNKKKKKPCLSAKKMIDNKINKKEKSLDKNKNLCPSAKKDEKQINIFMNLSNGKLKNEKENNINLVKSPSPLLSQSKSFPFDKELDEPKKAEQVKVKNDIPEDNIDNINNINDINFQAKTNINFNIESNEEEDENSIRNINNNLSYNIISKKNNNYFNERNIPIISNIYTPYTASDKFFDSLTQEINNYKTVTLNNISLLSSIRNKYLMEIENLIKSNLDLKYEIKYGHYGSHFTNLSIEGSDLDILIYYKNKKGENNNEFFNDILNVLNQNVDKFELIQPILTASVPVIKLQISIENDIKGLKLEYMSYFEGQNELNKINFDLTFTQNEQEYLHSQQVVEYINKSINTYPIITNLILVLKRYFKIMKMNKSFHGGLSSYSLYLLILSFCKKFPTVITSQGKALFSFLGIFSFFEFDKLGVDIESQNIFYYLNNTISEDNFQKKEINIIDPLTKLNVAKSSFKVDEIQMTLRSAYDFLRTEGCYYDYAVFVHKTGYDTDFFKQIKNNYDIFDNNDFKIIKKMFTLNKKGLFCDFFAN